jgi:tetratricopeptide (TPR) repeat protein
MDFIKKLFRGKQVLKNYQKGISFYNRKQFKEAIALFGTVLKEKSLASSFEYNLAEFYCSQANRNIGIIEFTKGNDHQALINFQTALKFNPNHPDLNYFIGICLNNIGKFQEALESFDKLQQIDPENIPNKLKMAVIFYNLGMWDNAEKVNRTILAKQPKYADVHFYLGLSLLSQSNASDAAISFEKALKINPNYTSAKLKLGIAQICIGEFDKAAQNLNSILKKHCDYADINYLLGIIKGEVKDIDAAIKYLEKAVSLSPKFKNAQVKLILSYFKADKIELAAKQLSQAAGFYPDDKRLNLIQTFIDNAQDLKESGENSITAKCEKMFGNDKLAQDLVNEFSTHLDIMPSFSEMIALFSNAKYAKEDESISELMIPLILENIEKHPDWPDLYSSLGLQFLFKGKLVEAEAAFNKAVALNPNYVDARINLMKTLKKMGEFKQAYKYGKVLLSKNLPYPDVYFAIAEILVSLDRYEDALNNAKRVLELSPEMRKAHLLVEQIYQKLEKK